MTLQSVTVILWFDCGARAYVCGAAGSGGADGVKESKSHITTSERQDA